MRGPAVNGQTGAPLNLEAFVLHTRSASLVTVGQFDGPDDPALHATKRILASVKPFENVNVFPLVTKILGLESPKVDGSVNVLSNILTPSAAEEAQH